MPLLPPPKAVHHRTKCAPPISKTRALLLLSLLLPIAKAQQPPLQPTAQTLGQDLLQASGSTGLVLVVLRDNETYLGGFGETAPNSGQRPTADSLLRLCSLTKIFTTDLLLKLQADHLVRLDTPLQSLAPPQAVVPQRLSREITLGDLATHTAGLPREAGIAPRATPHFTFPDYAQRWAWLPRQHLRTTPGTAAAYSNIGFDLLADALESAARQPYPRLLAARTLTQLGLHETTFTPTPAQCSRLLVSAHDQGPCTSTLASDGSGGLYSTPRDMVPWLRYLLNTQPPAAQAVYLDPTRLTSVQGLDHGGDPTGIGLGWIHILAPGDALNPPTEIVEKTGGGAGFLTYIALNRAHRIAIFVAATDGAVETHLNLFHAANDLLLNLAGLPPLPPEPPRPAPKPHPKHARRPAHAVPGISRKVQNTRH